MKFPHLISRCVPQRWVVSVECSLGLVVSYMMRFCLVITITEMTVVYGAKRDPHSCPYIGVGGSNNTTKVMEFKWTAAQQGIIHSGIFWGYISTQVLGGVLSDLLNHKTVCLFGIFITCVATALTPPATRYFDWIGLIVCRVIVGMAQGVFYNSLHSITGHWIPTQERGTLGTLVFSGVQFGNALNTFLTGELLGYMEWTTIFYIYSIIGMFWAIIFFFTTYANPADVPRLSARETQIFEEYKSQVDHMKEHKKLPVKAILKNYHVWAIFFAMFGQDWCFYTVVVYIPTYMKSVLHMDIHTIGIVNSVSYLLLWFIGFTVGFIADYIHQKEWISLSWIRRSLYLFGTIFPAFGLVGVSYAECDKILAIILFIACFSTLGLFYPSVKVNPMDLSPNFAGTIGSIGQMGGCAAGVLVPYVTSFLTPNSFKSEWRIVFWISFGVLLFGGLSFFCLASGEVQPFNQYKEAAKAPDREQIK